MNGINNSTISKLEPTQIRSAPTNQQSQSTFSKMSEKTTGIQNSFINHSKKEEYLQARRQFVSQTDQFYEENNLTCLNLEDFKKWLDTYQFVRDLIRDVALMPRMWSLENDLSQNQSPE